MSFAKRVLRLLSQRLSQVARTTRALKIPCVYLTIKSSIFLDDRLIASATTETS